MMESLLLLVAGSGTGERILKYGTVFLIGSVKYLWSMAAGLGMGFELWEIMLTAAFGAWLGVIVFTYFGNEIRHWTDKRFNSKGKRTSFSRRRKIYLFWKRFGLTGTAALAPFISPAFSVAIAVSFREKTQKIILYLFISLFIWSIVLTRFGGPLFALMRGEGF